jgi:hypothetical protein
MQQHYRLWLADQPYSITGSGLLIRFMNETSSKVLYISKAMQSAGPACLVKFFVSNFSRAMQMLSLGGQLWHCGRGGHVYLWLARPPIGMPKIPASTGLRHAKT